MCKLIQFKNPCINPLYAITSGEWRKLHNEELRDLYYLPNIVQVVKSRRMRWAGHVARGGGERCAQGSSGET